ncbi:MAG: bifunctional diaminohydroxyphosphoribosylaminopyrimidine deaminase/5-amino-6-(5-phosphoribosylamino)uracil reductase RibD [Verrucomicrobiae bacterium]|nr:bifunctional diaminohydroxyphosphoribosylaminopyrimidine deaminase/5-amino-6-(5-phosphoribosylamino)uracil reductase RibD [Verrucomicrobiae bacterium]
MSAALRPLPDAQLMRLAIKLARRGYGLTSPNPMVGAVLVKAGKPIGVGWHRGPGCPHAEIEAIRDACRRGHTARGATLVVTLEPCSSYGRTPPCTDAIIAAGIKRVVIGAIDPNPAHSGRAIRILRGAGIDVSTGVCADECTQLNEPFNHWIVHRTPFVTVKAAMTLDGKIATATGESKWITGAAARTYAMHLRRGADAILVGINTVLADDPSLTVRRGGRLERRQPRRIVLDAMARTPPDAQVVTDAFASQTTIVVSECAPRARVLALAARTNVLIAPLARPAKPANALQLDLQWLLKRLGAEAVTSLLVEGGGEVNASFLLGGLTNRVAFFYSPKVIGGLHALRAVAGNGVTSLADAVRLCDVGWRKLGDDLLVTAKVK